MCIQRHYAHGVAGFSWNNHYRGIVNSGQAGAFDVPALYLPITPSVEDLAIRLRRTRRMKLPDAIVAASALETEAKLLTFDRQLRSIVADKLIGWPMKPD